MLSNVILLNDVNRTKSFINAIQEVVNPGDVVVDIGTGTGILAMVAANAGARKVYALESSPIVYTAEKIVAANGMSDRIEVIPISSTGWNHPECVDVIISETISDSAFNEGIIRTMIDAKRFSKPTTKIIPRNIKIFGIPIELSSEYLDKIDFTSHNLMYWTDLYGFDFSPLSELNLDSSANVAFRDIDYIALAHPTLIAEVDLLNINTNKIDISTRINIQKKGTLHGLLVYFDVSLSNNVSITNLVNDTHWRVRLVTLSHHKELIPLDDILVRYRIDNSVMEKIEVMI